MALSRNAPLVGWARHGDDAAFEQLHARHRAAILAFCRHLTGNREDAEDAVQHTFLAAYRRLADSAEATEWRPWLFTVARNRCLTLLRARRGEDPLVEPDLATSFDGLALEVERRQELRDLVGDMGRLPEPQRAALVLSQLDALSYREIGTVLDVAPEKVKALVFQARSSLASAREAREAPCFEIRHELATARGAALRRRMLRRHVGQCEGCRDFEVAMRRQRHDLGLLLPVAPSVGLGQAVLDAIGRDTTTAGGAGMAAAGGGVGASVGGTLTAIGLPGIAKLAVVVAVVGGGASGALAADLPARVGDAAPWHEASDRPAVDEPGVDPDGSDDVARDGGSPDPRSVGPEGDDRAGGNEGEKQSDGDERALAAEEREAAAPGSGDGEEPEAPVQSDTDEREALPPGLAKHDELPPGLAKRDGELPPGLAKRGGASRPEPGDGAGSPGNGNGGGNGGQGNGNAGNQGQGGGAPGGGQGNAGGNGGGSGGQGNGNAGGQGQGNGNGGTGQSGAGGQGNAGGNGNGNAGGNPR